MLGVKKRMNVFHLPLHGTKRVAKHKRFASVEKIVWYVETIGLPSLAFRYTVLATIFSNSISSSVVNPKKLGSQWTPAHTSKQKGNEVPHAAHSPRIAGRCLCSSTEGGVVNLKWRTQSLPAFSRRLSSPIGRNASILRATYLGSAGGACVRSAPFRRVPTAYTH